MVAPPVLVALVLLGASPAHPRVDISAMKEAIEAPTDDYSSASAYAHFLRARLLALQGEHARSMEQLRLALASDPGRPELVLALAEAQARAGAPARAEATVRGLLERKPDHVPALLFLGRLLFETDRPQRAREVLERVRKLAPREQEPYLLLAEMALESGHPEEAVRTVQALADLNRDTTGLRRLGMALVDRGEPETARALLEKTVQIDPGDAEAEGALGEALEALGRPADAEAAYARALERDPDSREVLLRAGRLALRSGSEPRARAYLDRLASLDIGPEQSLRIALTWLSAGKPVPAIRVLEQARAGSDDPRLLLALGLVQGKSGRWADAARAYGQVPRGAPGWKDAVVQRGLALARAGEPAAAERATADALTQAPGDVALEAGHAAVLEAVGDPGRAERFLEGRIRASGSTELVTALAQIFSRTGAHTEAVSVLTDALKAHPRDEELLYALGTVLERGGATQEALGRMRELLEVNPRNAAALNFIGYTLADHGEQLEEAERLVRRALAIRPDSGAYLDSLGWVQFRRGDVVHATGTLERAAELEPDEPTILEHLGDAYGGASRRDAAVGAYRRALEAMRTTDDPQARERTAVVQRKLKALTSPVADR
ncbi:MAG TPA: tetratricopeptide repeat protein [Myxococcaceae bacterium]|nr:tetratricopeptide repeat protein [Myxococcaceae bacterium]